MVSAVNRFSIPFLLALVMSGGAMAQSVFSQKEKSTADAASERLVDPNATDKSAISDSLAQPVAEDPGSLSVPAKTIDAVSVPVANPISLDKCSCKKVIIKT